MKLYEVPRETHIKVIDNGETLFFHHVDGAYSLCTTATGEVVHLPASTKVEIVKH